MTLFIDELQKALDTHDKVTVFVQDLKDIKAFLIDKPGRWWVKINPLFWRKNELTGVAVGRPLSGHKVGVTWDESFSEVGEICETSGQPRIYFTQIPTTKIEGSFIIKRRFILPVFTTQKHPGSQVVFCGNRQSYLNYCEQLGLHGANYTTPYSGGVGQFHLAIRIMPVRADVIIVKYKPSLEEISLLHNSVFVLLDYEKTMWGEMSYERVKSIIQCFHESPGSILGIPYIATKTFLHPKLIKSILDFLVRNKCLEVACVDTSKVVVHQNHKEIVNGEYKASVAAKILNIQKETLPAYLKKAGINASYYPSQKEFFWKYKTFIKEEAYNILVRDEKAKEEALNVIIDNGEVEFNRFIDRKIESECIDHGKKALMFNGDEATHINFKPTHLQV